MPSLRCPSPQRLAPGGDRRRPSGTGSYPGTPLTSPGGYDFLVLNLAPSESEGTTAARLADFRLTEQRGLTWYRSSPAQRRGFCKICGGNLFGQENEGTVIYIAAETLDGPTGLKLAAHIFVGDKANYYHLDDGLPQHDDGKHGIAFPEVDP